MGYLDNTGLAYLWGKIKAKLVQPDWKQNDKTAPDYVKNRPFYTENLAELTILSERNLNFNASPSGSGSYVASVSGTFDIVAGNSYKVSWDGTVYACDCVRGERRDLVLGNYFNIAGDEPFSIFFDDNSLDIYTMDNSTTHTVAISTNPEKVIKVDRKYIPAAQKYEITSSYDPDTATETLSCDLSFNTAYFMDLENLRAALTYQGSHPTGVYLYATRTGDRFFMLVFATAAYTDDTYHIDYSRGIKWDADGLTFVEYADPLDRKADKSTTTEATLLTSGWTGDSAPYSYNLSVMGVTPTSNQELLPALGITVEQLEALQAANIQDGGQAAGSITLKAFGEDKPTIDLPIRIILRGD